MGGAVYALHECDWREAGLILNIDDITKLKIYIIYICMSGWCVRKDIKIHSVNIEDRRMEK